MAKFVKLENGKYLNVDTIILITPNGDGGTVNLRDDRCLIVTDKDVENILNTHNKVTKLSKESAKIALNAMANKQCELGLEAGAALEKNDSQGMSYAQDLKEQADEISDAIAEIEELSGINLDGFGSKGDAAMKARGL